MPAGVRVEAWAVRSQFENAAQVWRARLDELVSRGPRCRGDAELELWRVGVERTRLGGVCSAAHGQGHLKSRKSGFGHSRRGWDGSLDWCDSRCGLDWRPRQTGWWLILKGEPTDLTLGYRILTATSVVWVKVWVWMGTARDGIAV